MSALELALNMLAEATTTTLTNSQGLEENRTMSELTEKRQKKNRLRKKRTRFFDFYSLVSAFFAAKSCEKV